MELARLRRDGAKPHGIVLTHRRPPRNEAEGGCLQDQEALGAVFVNHDRVGDREQSEPRRSHLRPPTPARCQAEPTHAFVVQCRMPDGWPIRLRAPEVVQVLLRNRRLGRSAAIDGLRHLRNASNPSRQGNLHLPPTEVIHQRALRIQDCPRRPISPKPIKYRNKY